MLHRTLPRAIDLRVRIETRLEDERPGAGLGRDRLSWGFLRCAATRRAAASALFYLSPGLSGSPGSAHRATACQLFVLQIDHRAPPRLGGTVAAPVGVTDAARFWDELGCACFAF
jgi:hypothetical protein